MRLSKTQERALVKLLDYPNGESAYGLDESLSTLQALAKKGLLKKVAGLGSMWSPRTNIEFRLSQEGVALAVELKKTEVHKDLKSMTDSASADLHRALSQTLKTMRQWRRK